jgi:hypothetical protein
MYVLIFVWLVAFDSKTATSVAVPGFSSVAECRQAAEVLHKRLLSQRGEEIRRVCLEVK